MVIGLSWSHFLFLFLLLCFLPVVRTRDFCFKRSFRVGDISCSRGSSWPELTLRYLHYAHSEAGEQVTDEISLDIVILHDAYEGQDSKQEVLDTGHGACALWLESIETLPGGFAVSGIWLVVSDDLVKVRLGVDGALYGDGVGLAAAGLQVVAQEAVAHLAGAEPGAVIGCELGRVGLVQVRSGRRDLSVHRAAAAFQPETKNFVSLLNRKMISRCFEFCDFFPHER